MEFLLEFKQNYWDFLLEFKQKKIEFFVIGNFIGIFYWDLLIVFWGGFLLEFKNKKYWDFLLGFFIGIFIGIQTKIGIF